jgi:hypothetical protein
MSSALDTQDEHDDPRLHRPNTLMAHQSHPITASAATSATPTPTPTHKYNLASPPTPPHPNFPAAIPGRHRLTSLLHEGAEAAHHAATRSPLAQMFTPFVVPEESSPPVPAYTLAPLQDNGAAAAAGEPSAARRRRLSSVSGGGGGNGGVRWPANADREHAAVAARRFPTGGSAASLAVSQAGTLSESPDERGEHEASPVPAEEAEEELAGVGNMELARKLEEIESRQRRIEEMLAEVVKAVRKDSD